jgi:hypothetical protein
MNNSLNNSTHLPLTPLIDNSLRYKEISDILKNVGIESTAMSSIAAILLLIGIIFVLYKNKCKTKCFRK